MPNPLILIPARLQAIRLPGKPLAEICGEPMIVHVWRRAVESRVGRVVVATDSERVAVVIRDAGGEAVMTRDDHVSGSDRIYEAACLVDPDGNHDIIVNVQGDLPTLEPRLVRACMSPLASMPSDIATLAAEIKDASERNNPNVVKAIGTPSGANQLRALYFTRATAPYGDGPLYHHIGMYAYKRGALSRFVGLPPSLLERRERLEQLRAIENGMRIEISLVETVPLGVDTPADLERARRELSRH